MNVLVAGAGGMVGHAVARECQRAGDNVFPFDRETLDVADAARVNSVVEGHRPDVIINCAAWTDVDGCESDPDRAHAVNTNGPENLALASREVGAGFVTISTDYVFDGQKDGFYTQRDQPNPLSVYAMSKLNGEYRAHLCYARAIIVRTGFIFGPRGRNYLSTFVPRAREGQTIKAISDSAGTPTYALDLARRLRELAHLDLPGIYHVVNAGPGATYQEIVEAGLEEAGLFAAVEPILSSSLTRPAARPQNSRLSCLLSEKIGLQPMRFWREALSEFVLTQI